LALQSKTLAASDFLAILVGTSLLILTPVVLVV
jgi:hypothetical protein